MASLRKRSLRKQISDRQLTFARLEPRQLLAADFQITEFLASNSAGINDDNGVASDWIEIFNAGTSLGNLAGYTLTDDAGDPTKYTLPSRNVGAGQYLIVFANTDAAPTTGSALYTGFKLSAGGEYVALFDPAGNLLSEFGANGADYPAQSQDVSYGVQFTGSSIASPQQVGFFNSPSPGSANGTLSAGTTAQVKSSTPAGFYDSSFQVSLSTETSGATIRYTTDGSEPSATNGFTYNNPITVNQTTVVRAVATKANYNTAFSETWSYIFVDDVLTQSNNGQAPAGFPADWSVGQSNFGQPLRNAPQVTDYGIDPAVRNRTDANGGDENIKNALLSIPTWSITTDVDNLFGSTGIYTNALEDGRAWERSASVELINPDGSEGFQVNAGLRIRGGFSRLGSNPKHSFRLLFRSEYGDSNLEYPVHGDNGVDVFDKIDLRTAQNSSWNSTSGERNNFIVEEFNRQNQLAVGQPSTRSSWLHLYLNGQYWGLYQTQERAEGDFAADYLGGDSDNFDVIKPDAGPNRPYINVASGGDLTAYTALHQQAAARAADGTTPAFVNNAAYYRAQGLNPDGSPNANFETLLDVDNLIDYMANILYSANNDAPIARFVENNAAINNYIAIRDRTGDEGFQYFVHDSELSFRDLDDNRNGPFNFPVYEANANRFNPQWLHQQLMANAEYRIAFADRLQATYFNDGPLTTAKMLARFDQLASEIDQAIIAESARWGDAQNTNPRLRQDWLNAVANIRDGIIAQRHPVFLNQLKNTILELRTTPGGSYNRTVSAPLFPNVDAPEFSINGGLQHGGLIDNGDNLTFNGSGGTIYYTTDGSDPREVGGAINSNAQIYNSNSNSTTLVQSGSSWKYLDNGSNQGTAWRNATFNDSAWATGNGELGYGDGGESTVIGFGGDPSDKHITTYFRKQFNSTGNFQSATLSVRRDDGVVVYINGTEVVRDNLPTGPILHTTLAQNAIAGANEATFIDFNIPANLLVAGTNTIAVEVHQVGSNSSDLSFDAMLIASTQSAAGVTLNNTTPVLSRVRSSNGTWSALQSATFVVADEVATGSNIRISEINYNPAAGDAEFIELQNINSAGGASVDLSNVTLSNGPSTPLTLAEGTTLAAGQYGLLVGDVAAFTAAYPSVSPALILGTYEGSLSNSGEGITLLASDSSVINDLNYADSDPFSIAADGAGASLELISPATTPVDQLSKYYRWQGSYAIGGTPGAAAVIAPSVVINEVFAHSDAPNYDFIELRNNGSTAINIGGWYLSDSAGALNSFQIPAGTVIPGGGYVVFDESDFNTTGGSSFGLSSNGDEVWLTSGTGSATKFIDEVSFGSTFNGVSIGRSANGTGRFLPLASRTPNATNTAAAVSALLISEVNYHPADPSAIALTIEPGLTGGDLEFVELTNTLSTTINLSDYRLRGESDFDFTSETIAGGESVVVVTFDPADPINTNRALAFRANYGISPAVQLIGDSSGALSNSFGKVSLQRADAPNADGTVPYALVDEMLYDDRSPWPAADGTGLSLNRLVAFLPGTLSVSWTGSSPTPGSNALLDYAPEVLASVRDDGEIDRPDLLDTISYVFDADVIVSKSHLQLLNQTLGSSVNVNVASVGFSYDATTLTATWDVSALNLEEAIFQATLSQAVLARGSNIALDGDGNQTAGGNHIQQIYVAIPGDINLDGAVNASDLDSFTQANSGSVGNISWSTGDFDGDGDRDITDVNIFTGTESGDLAALLRNVGKDVGNVQPVTFQPVVSRPVVSQPVKSELEFAQPISVAVVLPPPVEDSAPVEASALVENSAPVEAFAPVEEPALVEAFTPVEVFAPVEEVRASVEQLSVSVAETLPGVEPTSQPLLAESQIYVDASDDDLSQITFASDAYANQRATGISQLALSGSVELLDDAFAEDVEGEIFDVTTDLDEADLEAIF